MANNKQRRQQWLQFSRLQIAMEKRWYKPIEKALAIQAAPVIPYLRKNGPQMTLMHLDVLIKPDPLVPVYNAMYRKESTAYVSLKYNQMQKQYGPELSREPTTKALGFGISQLWEDLLNAFIREYVGNKIVRVTRTTVEYTRLAIQKGIAEGLSVNDIVKDLQYVNGFGPRRSRVISRTETVGIMNHGNFVVASSMGLVMNDTWWSAQDHRVRRTHQLMHGETVRHGERFSNGLLYPGDPAGSAEEVIQCRCTTLQEPARDAAGRLIRTATQVRPPAPRA